MERWQADRLERAREALTDFIQSAAKEQERISRQIEEARRALAAIDATRNVPVLTKA